MSSQSWMSLRTSRTGSSLLSLSLRWGLRTVQHSPVTTQTNSNFYCCGYCQEVKLVAGQTGLLGLPQVHLHRLPQVPGQPVASRGQSHHCLWRFNNRWYFGPSWYTWASLFTALFIVFPYIMNFRGREDTFWVKVSWGGHKKSKAKAQVSQAGRILIIVYPIHNSINIVKTIYQNQLLQLNQDIKSGPQIPLPSYQQIWSRRSTTRILQM